MMMMMIPQGLHVNPDDDGGDDDDDNDDDDDDTPEPAC